MFAYYIAQKIFKIKIDYSIFENYIWKIEHFVPYIWKILQSKQTYSYLSNIKHIFEKIEF